jgi:DNA-directed RNA polymerase specialized sigma24 family protein
MTAADWRAIIDTCRAEAERMGCSSADAEDVAQQVCLRMLEAAPRSMLAFARRCASRLAMSVRVGRTRAGLTSGFGGLGGAMRGPTVRPVTHDPDAIPTDGDQEAQAIAGQVAFRLLYELQESGIEGDMHRMQRKRTRDRIRVALTEAGLASGGTSKRCAGGEPKGDEHV